MIPGSTVGEWEVRQKVYTVEKVTTVGILGASADMPHCYTAPGTRELGYISLNARQF